MKKDWVETFLLKLMLCCIFHVFGRGQNAEENPQYETKIIHMYEPKADTDTGNPFMGRDDSKMRLYWSGIVSVCLSLEGLMPKSCALDMFTEISLVLALIRRSTRSVRSWRTRRRRSTSWGRFQGRPTASWCSIRSSPLRPTWASCRSSGTRTNWDTPWLEETSASNFQRSIVLAFWSQIVDVSKFDVI